MANVKVSWTLPTVRESGKPLAVSDIKEVRLFLSADGGANYGELSSYPPSVLETVVTELEPGEWFFRGVVIDTKDRAGAPDTKGIVIEDPTPPGALVLNLSLA
jgi:hypothetical protein